jgi:hypothetical protein
VHPDTSDRGSGSYPDVWWEFAVLSNRVCFVAECGEVVAGHVSELQQITRRATPTEGARRTNAPPVTVSAQRSSAWGRPSRRGKDDADRADDSTVH